MNRYYNNDILVDNFSRPKYATSNLCSQIYYACENGEIPFITIRFKQGDRLDHLSGKYYGNGLDWWVIAAASGISWWLQINEDTIIKIPDREALKARFNL